MPSVRSTGSQAACESIVPKPPGEAPISPTGLSPNTRLMSLPGRDSQSIAFLNTPGMPLLYSGVASNNPSAVTMASFSEETFPAHQPSALALTSIAILGLACTAVAMLLMFYLVNNAGPARASVITYINPAVAALLGVVVLHEHLGIGGITAFAMILAGSWLATRARN